MGHWTECAESTSGRTWRPGIPDQFDGTLAHFSREVYGRLRWPGTSNPGFDAPDRYCWKEVGLKIFIKKSSDLGLVFHQTSQVMATLDFNDYFNGRLNRGGLVVDWTGLIEARFGRTESGSWRTNYCSWSDGAPDCRVRHGRQISSSFLNSSFGHLGYK